MRAGVDIAVANRPDHLRLGQVDKVVITLLVLLQSGARSIVFRLQPGLLDCGAIGTVLDQDPLRRGSLELLALGHGFAFGRRPSMWQIA